MDRWLNNTPALVFVKDVSTWFVVNHHCKPLMWTQDKSEVAWYLAFLECGANEEAKNRLVRKMRRKTTAQESKGTSQPEKQKPAVVIPLRNNGTKP